MNGCFTHYWNVSLYLGDQLLFLVLVLYLRFLSARLGPTALTSTNGRNMVFVCQLMLFTPTTARQTNKQNKCLKMFVEMRQEPQRRSNFLCFSLSSDFLGFYLQHYTRHTHPSRVHTHSQEPVLKYTHHLLDLRCHLFRNYTQGAEFY